MSRDKPEAGERWRVGDDGSPFTIERVEQGVAYHHGGMTSLPFLVKYGALLDSGDTRIETAEEIAKRCYDTNPTSAMLRAIRADREQIAAKCEEMAKAYTEPHCDDCDRPGNMRRHAPVVCPKTGLPRDPAVAVLSIAALLRGGAS